MKITRRRFLEGTLVLVSAAGGVVFGSTPVLVVGAVLCTVSSVTCLKGLRAARKE